MRCLKMINYLNELETILETENIITVFQPIVSLKDGSIIGYEALSRGPEDSPLNLPKQLFDTAAKFNKLWDLEKLCRIKAIQRASYIDKNKFLFINVDPHILNDEKFIKGFTKEFLYKHNMSPETIIFEITERTSIEDYKSFRKALDNYLEEGYKIAIDDTGAGYSGLKTISETKPHYIKIDMDIVRNVHIDSFKKSLIKSLVSLCQDTNMNLIAEGIENEEELNALIDLGVYAGQGYFLQKPTVRLLEIPEIIKNKICKYYRESNNKYKAFNDNVIGEIASYYTPFTLTDTCVQLKNYLEKNNLFGCCIVHSEIPVGIVMKHSLNSVFATQYGIAVFSKRHISLIMDNNPLIVDYNTPICDVSNAAMNREIKNIYDDILVTKCGKYYGIVSVKNLLEYTTLIERNYAKQLNPLTGLPGNSMIESNLYEAICQCKDYCLLYLDLDNFKIYNDTYGFENGDKMIKFTSKLIESKLKEHFPCNSFIGHIGGDDFVCLIDTISQESCEKVCKELISEFDSSILDFFNETDRENGFVVAADRKGLIDTFPLTSISIAGIQGSMCKFSNVSEISKFISNIKHDCKKIHHSSFIIKQISDMRKR